MQTRSATRNVAPDVSSDVRIVRATLADLPAISELAALVWRRYYPGIITPAQIEYMLERMYNLETLSREIAEGGIVYERLEVAGALAGFAAYGPAEAPGECKLHKLYLHPQVHRRGHGSRLLVHVAAEARRRGYATLILAVNKHNAQAIRAYEKNGFVRREAVVNDIGGGFVMDDYIMAKVLRPQR